MADAFNRKIAPAHESIVAMVGKLNQAISYGQVQIIFNPRFVYDLCTAWGMS